ncbi:PAS domain S-box protein [Singulisphaera sp. Ch08]|uniref:PAS domain S-box protein n=1 Tax=Singulisphaera sp. Ch08 TaxID=3120278 RepID=A0AAU7CDH6_9BACT
MSEQVKEANWSSRSDKLGEALLAEAQQLAHVGSWNWDLVSGTVLWSDEQYRIFGLRPQEMVMTYDRVLSHVHPDDRATFHRVVDQASRNHQPFEFSFRALHRDGTFRVVLSRGQVELDGDGKPVRMFGAVQDITERTQTEDALRSSERRFRAVFEGALDGMIVADNDGRFVDANPAACSLYGTPRDQLLGKSNADFAEPGVDFGGAWAEFRRSGSAQGTHRLLRPDGSVRETEYASTADFLPGLHLAVLRDVTERVRAERALRESERRVVAILESISDSFYTLDHQWRFSYINPQAEPILGRSGAELLGRNVWEEFPEAVGTAFDHQYHRAVAERVPVHFEIDYPPLGGRFSIHAYPSSDGLSVYFTDVTERHRAEEALRQSEQRFRRVLENSRDIIYQYNIATRTCDYASPSVRDILGYNFEELDAGGLPLVLTSIHPEDLERLEGRMSQLMTLRSGAEFDPVIEYRVRVPGQGWRWMSDSGTVVRDERGHPVAVVGNIRDVTDKRMAAERLRDLSRRLIRAQEEERRHIAFELHDEIGQALFAIKLNMRAVLCDPASPAATHRLEECVELVDRTIRQVRDISLDLRPSLLDDLGLVAALRAYVSEFALRSGAETQFVAEDDTGRMDPDVETACYRIAQEALTNVARHAGAGHVRVELVRSGSGLRLVVADDGRGFEVAAATARAVGGSSLGVLGMRERAVLVGGHVEITSAPGRGTEVRLTVPLALAGEGA